MRAFLVLALLALPLAAEAQTARPAPPIDFELDRYMPKPPALPGRPDMRANPRPTTAPAELPRSGDGLGSCCFDKCGPCDATARGGGETGYIFPNPVPIITGRHR